MYRSFCFCIFCHCRQMVLVLGVLMTPLALHAQSRTAANQFNSTTVNDQVNLQVLDAVVVEMNNSFTRSCTDPHAGNSQHAHGSSWTNTYCPLGQSGVTTNTCISGYIAMLSSTCN